MQAKQQVRNAALNLALLVLSLVLALSIAEYGFEIYEDRESNPEKLVQALPGVRDRDKNHFLILGVGESTLRGEPYGPDIDPVAILIKYLKDTYPEATFSQTLHGYGGAVLTDLTNSSLNHLKRSPDLIVIIAGHNDFLGRWSPNAECEEESSLRTFMGERSAFVRFFIERLNRKRVGQRPVGRARTFFDRPVACNYQFFEVMRSYKQSLEQWAVFSQRSKTPLLFVFPAANEAAFPPSRSVYSGAAKREEFNELYRRGRLYFEQQDFHQAISCFEEAEKYDSNFAELAYQIGRAYRLAGRAEEAKKHFQKAKENDGYPLRALEFQLKLMQDVAARYDIPVINADALLRADSLDGILDQRLFHDAHHPSIRGYNLIGYSLYRRALEIDALKLGDKRPQQILSEEDLLRLFSFDKDDWHNLIKTRIAWFDMAHALSFDASERNRSQLMLLEMFRLLSPSYFQEYFADKHRRLREEVQSIARAREAELKTPQEQIGKCSGFPKVSFVKNSIASEIRNSDAKSLVEQFPWFQFALSAVYPDNSVRIGSVAADEIYCHVSPCRNGVGGDGAPLIANKTSYADGFLAHPDRNGQDSWLAFPLDNRFSKFTAGVGILDVGNERSLVECSVIGDDKVLYRSPLLKAGVEPASVEVSVQGVKRLVLRCHMPSADSAYNYSAWLNPVLQ